MHTAKQKNLRSLFTPINSVNGSYFESSYSDSHYFNKRYLTLCLQHSCGNNITVWVRLSQRCNLSIFLTLSLTLTLYVGMGSVRIATIKIGTAPMLNGLILWHCKTEC